ncbi:MAG: hypothetical protein EOP83_02140 [Verrucomicrobiaceae bacterium]|nr:MAG: hypothetical protein EOP83_02140 [Verrucomicrobiaceae bacterium]
MASILLSDRLVPENFMTFLEKVKDEDIHVNVDALRFVLRIGENWVAIVMRYNLTTEFEQEYRDWCTIRHMVIEEYPDVSPYPLLCAAIRSDDDLLEWRMRWT